MGWSALGDRLRGRTVFMSASIPAPDRAEKFRRVADAAIEIEQAAVSLARAVFSEGGRLVFGGHPTISPLVAMVAGEYRDSRAPERSAPPLEPQALIYQSTLFRGRAAEDTMLMFRMGLAEVRWIDKDPSEEFGRGPKTGPKYPLSLERMRRAMISESKPDCMVCVGGMEGVMEEAALFDEIWPHHPGCVLRRTGGAAAILAESPGDRFVVIDDRVMARTGDEGRDQRSSGHAAMGPSKPTDSAASDPIPYPLIMQSIVDKVARSGDS